ncbi:MAG: hypothetical protein RR460_04385 [Clostridium sp.]
MYKAIFEIDNYKFHGTLDMYAIKRAQEELEECNKKMQIHEIFKGVADLDMHCITAIILQSIMRGGDICEEKFLELHLKDRSDENLEKNIENSMKFLSVLLKKCMPKNEESTEDEFEDIPELDQENIKDWDFPYMEYLWTTKLNKNDFWSVTPKNLFEQIEIFKRVNSEKTEEVECL